MIVLGLTGSIGMGKSTAGNMLEKMGCSVHSADKAVHALLAPGGACFEHVAVTFPEAWDKKKHIIRRDILGQIVFQDDAKRKELEDILHPAVREMQQEFLKQQNQMGRKIAALDIPLLFETGADKRVDYTLAVTAPAFVQRQRVMARHGMTLEKFAKILQTQMADGEKRARADFVVHTGLGLGYTYRKLQKIVRKICLS